MKFKLPGLEDELHKTPKKLQEICARAEELANELNKELTVTRVYGKIKGDTGVHLDWRAVDFRNQIPSPLGNDWVFLPQEIDHIVNTLNSEYPRTDGHIVALHHSFCGGPFHLHVQIPVAWKDPVPKESKNDESECDPVPA